MSDYPELRSDLCYWHSAEFLCQCNHLTCQFYCPYVKQYLEIQPLVKVFWIKIPSRGDFSLVKSFQVSLLILRPHHTEILVKSQSCFCCMLAVQPGCGFSSKFPEMWIPCLCVEAELWPEYSLVLGSKAFDVNGEEQQKRSYLLMLQRYLGWAFLTCSEFPALAPHFVPLSPGRITTRRTIFSMWPTAMRASMASEQQPPRHAGWMDWWNGLAGRGLLERQEEDAWEEKKRTGSEPHAQCHQLPCINYNHYFLKWGESG